MPLSSCFSSRRRTTSDTPNPSSLPHNVNCRTFSLSELKAATNNFHPDHIIGHGPFSHVYKGHVGDGHVAITRLSAMSEQGSRLFKAEVRVLCQLSHPNILGFIGISEREGDVILVNEYMPNGTLRDRLCDAESPLGWTQRLEICVHAARGLHYLHAGARTTLLHRGVRPENILLDGNMTAKISDFGLSRLMRHVYGVDDEYSPVEADLCYFDEEFMTKGRYTTSSDVYSFGVVLFEVLCAKKPFDTSRGAGRASLAAWACECVKDGSVGDIISPCLVGKIAPDCLSTFVEVAAGCVLRKATERPVMGEVTERLETALRLQESYIFPLIDPVSGSCTLF